MTGQTEDSTDREVAAGLAELLERRGTSTTDGDDTMGTNAGSKPVTGGARSTRREEPEPVTSWLPQVVTLSDADVELLVTEMLRLNADVVAAIAAEGLGASHPGVAFMRVDVASRVTRWAALLLDRSRKMGSITTGGVPIVRDATSTAIDQLK